MKCNVRNIFASEGSLNWRKKKELSTKHSDERLSKCFITFLCFFALLKRAHKPYVTCTERAFKTAAAKKKHFRSWTEFFFRSGWVAQCDRAKKKELRFVANGAAVGVINSPQTRGDISLMSLDFSWIHLGGLRNLCWWLHFVLLFNPRAMFSGFDWRLSWVCSVGGDRRGRKSIYFTDNAGIYFGNPADNLGFSLCKRFYQLFGWRAFFIALADH